MDLGINGRTALVLGGGGGLGGAIARRLGAEGVKVAVADVSESAAATTVSAIRDAGGKARPIIWDLSDLRAAGHAVAEVQERFGAIDVLVNNTGGPPPTPVGGQGTSAWEDHFRSMVLSVIALTDHVLPGMRERRWGRVLTSTSSGVVAPIPNLGLSNALRSTLLGWSKTLAREVGPDGVTVNVLVPGRIATGRTQSLDEARAKREHKTVDQVTAESASSIPLGRYGRPDEYGAVAAFLASDLASYVTGSVIRVDGGLIAST